MKILMGSRAIKYSFPEFPREPVDYDYIVDKKSNLLTANYERVEQYIIPPLVKRFSPVLRNEKVLSPNQIYTLKVSHIFWDIKWEKTMFDIVWLQKNGCKLDEELFDELYEFWCKEKGTPKRADLAMTKDDFFDNGLKGGFDHDGLHKLINPVPTYTKILIDPDGVEVSEEKYNLLTSQEKIDLVREECYVMAYERLADRDYRTAYTWMVKQMILVHAPFYEAMFIIKNYNELRKPVFNYKEVLDEKLRRS